MTDASLHANGTELATLGGGCFWCVDAVFRRLRGVVDVESGYSQGRVERPSYEQVCGGDTGHNEVVRVWFDPAVISYRQVLEIFFTIHDPTTLNRQGNDVGEQYRSGIYTHSPEQAEVAAEVMAEVQANLKGGLLSGVLGNPKVVTEVEPERNYWPAEAYHQDYFTQHPNQGYCAFVVGPKVAKFEKTFKSMLK
jgi:peptide-methionine (S)-S-oxide reductase